MDDTTSAFATYRTRWFRTQELDAGDERAIANIERTGCHIIQVKAEGVNPGWSCTLGVHDGCGQPEVLVVGLRTQTAAFVCNEAAGRLRAGARLHEGRHREIVGEVECEFRPVDRKWIRHLMGWAVWFNGGDEFPVLQAVYPDRENRFPGEPDFDPAFAQPSLQPDVVMTRLEEDFWAAADPNSSLFDWKFPDPPHTTVFLSAAVQSGEEPVTYVSHDSEDGAWQFLGNSMSQGKLPLLSCFHHPIDKDPSLKELADLPVGWWAERSCPGDPGCGIATKILTPEPL